MGFCSVGWSACMMSPLERGTGQSALRKLSLSASWELLLAFFPSYLTKICGLYDCCLMYVLCVKRLQICQIAPDSYQFAQ